MTTEQISLFGEEPKSKERWVYELLLPGLMAVIENNNAPTDLLQYKKNKTNVSILLDYQNALTPDDIPSEAGRVLFRINCLKRKNYIEINNPYVCAPLQPGPEEKGFCVVPFELTEESITGLTQYVSDSLDVAIDKIKYEFGCCHLNQECSNAGKCISEIRSLALKCYYRRVLKSGRKFY